MNPDQIRIPKTRLQASKPVKQENPEILGVTTPSKSTPSFGRLSDIREKTHNDTICKAIIYEYNKAVQSKTGITPELKSKLNNAI